LNGSARPSLDGKTILITGATRGIGYAAAEALAAMGAHVIVHGRDAQRVQTACETIRNSAAGGNVSAAIADLGSLEEVRRLASEIQASCERLDVLVNNAGLVTSKRQETVDGLERQLAVNHLAPFLLTSLLLDKLKASARARIVNVSSNAHHRSAFDIDDLNWERRRYSGIGAYGATKLANILFTRELADRLEGTGVTANCLHPGVVATNIFTGMGVLGTIFGILSKPLLLPARRGAETSVYLAASPDIEDVSGQYFNESSPVEPHPAATDRGIARALWETSERLTGLRG
jgi:NAD(P)-dependent dehydrogenase (short-subunit alcohol dehydrogenase family)